MNEALRKLLELELDELIEHPQWQEVLSITLYYLMVSSTLVTDQVKIKCMKFLLRLAMGLPGHQAWRGNHRIADLSIPRSDHCLRRLLPYSLHHI